MQYLKLFERLFRKKIITLKKMAPNFGMLIQIYKEAILPIKRKVLFFSTA